MRELELYSNSLESEGKTKATIKNVNNFVQEFVEILGLDSNNINQIKLVDIDNYLYELTKRGNSDSTRKTKMAYIRGFVKYLYKRDILAKNITEDIKVSAPDSEVTHIEIEDVKKIIDRAKYQFGRGKDLDSYPIFIALFTTGMRIDCELLELKIDDIQDNGIFVSSGKGKKSRFIPTPQTTIDLLREYYKENKDGYVFTTTNGKKRQPSDVSRRLKRYAEHFGIRGDISPHKIRHSYAVNLLEQDVPMDVISKALGHSNVAITSKVYAKTSNQRLVDAMKNVQF